jgi:pimeloyl-ACP methyl ester carboxylesterase
MRQVGKMSAVIAAILVVCAAGHFVGQYRRYNLETLDITEAVRRHAAGEFLTLPGGVTHYELAGPENARTVVFIHGFSVPYFLWDHNFHAIAQAGFRVLRYDLYGRGLSARPNQHYDADLFDSQLSQLLAALKITAPVDLVAASMGGPIAVTFAARHPGQVRTVSLFDPAYHTGGSLPWQLRAPLVAEYLNCVEIAPHLVEAQRLDFRHPESYPEYFIRYEQMTHYKGFRSALLSTARYYLSRNDSADYQQLGRSGKPVLLVWGKFDEDVPFTFSDEVRKQLPQAEFHPIEDAAHVPYFEHPEIVNPMLAGFLHRH